MSTKTMSHNACYAFLRMAVPLSFNKLSLHLGFSSKAYGDVTRIGYTFYGYKGLFWYSVALENGHVMNSLFFAGLSNCVRDFRCLCETMCWELEDSSALCDFVARFNKSNKEGGR